MKTNTPSNRADLQVKFDPPIKAVYFQTFLSKVLFILGIDLNYPKGNYL
jgi:hypothetical protein